MNSKPCSWQLCTTVRTAAAGGEGSDAAAAAAGGLRGGLGLKGKKLLGQQAEEFLVQQVRDGSGASITPLNPDIASQGAAGVRPGQSNPWFPL